MKNIPLYLILILFSISSYGQNQIQISGQVKDSVSSKTLAYCSVIILDKKDSIISGGVTNESGYFHIPVFPGSYKMVLNYMGYVNDTTETGMVRNDKFFGEYFIRPDSRTINNVTVSSSSRINTIDRDIQIVTEEMRHGASDANDLLSRVSGVSLDRYKNTIKVDNSSNIMLLANGVEKSTDYIQNLSPERIKRIEIIRDPGGRYGLEGYTAIVNIILYNNYVGSEFFASDQLLVDIIPQDGTSHLPQNNLNLNYNYTYNKVNIYGSFRNNYNNIGLNTWNKTNYSDGTEIRESLPSNSLANTFIDERSYNYVLGSDIYINPKHTISFESRIQNLPKTKNNTNITYNTSVLKDEILNTSFDFTGNYNKEISSISNSVFYKGMLSNDEELSANFTYSQYDENYVNSIYQDGIEKRNEFGSNSRDNTNFNIEYNRKIKSTLNYRIGYGNIHRAIENSYTFTESNSTSESYVQKNTRHKLFGYASYKISNKISTKIGLAGEWSNVADDNQDKNYFIYQPLLDIKYNISNKLSFKLKYRSESDYPSLSESTPFTSKINPFTLLSGNANLAPSQTHKFSIDTKLFRGLLSFEPYYYFSDNLIGQTGQLNNDGIFELSYDNLGNYNEKGIRSNFTIPFSKKIIWRNTISVFSASITNKDIKNNVNDWNANSDLIYTGLKNGGIFLLNYHRQMSKNITAMGYERNSNDYMLFIYQQAFLKKKLTLMLGYFLPVNLGLNYIQDNYLSSYGYEQHQFGDIQLLKNLLIFKVNYRLNKGKIKKIEKKLELEKNESKGGFL